MPEERPKLTVRQRRFVEEYAADPVAVQAYFRAFGRTTNRGTRRTYGGASKSALRLLQNDVIKAEIEAAQAAYERRTRVSKARTLREIAAIAFADPADVYAPDPANGGLPMPRPWDEVPVGARKAISSVKIKRRRLKDKGDEATEWELEELEYKFHSKDAALDKLCKRLGLTKGDMVEAAAALLKVIDLTDKSDDK